MTRVRWGVLGTAGIAVKQLLPAMERSANADVTAIATRSNIEGAKQIAQQFSIEKVYSSYEKLLEDSEIDAVYIPLPNHLHKEWAIKAAKHGKHVLCEKPASLHEEDVIEMKKEFDANNVKFMEAFMYAFHPQHSRVKEVIASGEIGEIRYVSAGFSFHMLAEDKQENIRMNVKKGGGSIYDIGCYAIHAIRYVLAKEPKAVQVHGFIDPTYKVDTETVGYLAFDEGIQASFDTSINLPMRHEYHVFGTEGSIRVPRAFRPDLHGGEGIIIIQKDDHTVTKTINGDQYREQVEYFSRTILENKNIQQNSLEYSFNNMRVMDACYQSLKTGNKISINH